MRFRVFMTGLFLASLACQQVQPLPQTRETGTRSPPAPFAGTEVVLPVDLESVLNPEVITGLTQEQRDFLSENGFVVIHSQEAQFADIRRDVGTLEGQPYFLT